MFFKTFLILPTSETRRQQIAHGGEASTVTVEHIVLMEFV